MADTPLNLILIVATLTTGGCDRSPAESGRSSITVALPPARPATPRPGFNLNGATSSGQPGEMPAQDSIHDLAAGLH